MAQATQQADQLRTAILADPNAPTALQNLAADQTTWENLYLAALEQAGELLPDGTTPPISQNPLDHERDGDASPPACSPGPAGSGIISSGNVVAVLQRPAHVVRQQHRSDRAGRRPSTIHDNPIADTAHVEPVQPERASCRPASRTSTSTCRGCRTTSGPTCRRRSRSRACRRSTARPVIPLDLTSTSTTRAQDAGLASMTGPFTRRGQRLHSGRAALAVHRQLPERPRRPPASRARSASPPSSTPASTRSTFRLGDIQIGDIDIQHPQQPVAVPGRLRLHPDQGVHPPRQRRRRPADGHRDLADRGHRPADRAR